MGIFKANLETIQQHNREYEDGKHTYYMGLNEMSDWTLQEFQNRNTWRPSRTHGNHGTKLIYDATNNDSVPISIDYRDEVKYLA